MPRSSWSTPPDPDRGARLALPGTCREGVLLSDTILIFYGSYRSDRQGIRLAHYLVDAFRARGADAELIDAKALDLPMLDPVGGGPATSSSSTIGDVREALAGLGYQPEEIRESLRELPGVLDVRGRGLMVAADVDADAPGVARRALLEQRLVINATGPGTLRFLPPLVLDESHVDDAVERLAAVLP